MVVRGATITRIMPVPMLAFDIGGTRLKAGLVEGDGVSHLRVVPTPGAGPALRQGIVRLGREVLAGERAAGVGVSVRGIIDPARGCLLDGIPPLDELVGLPLTEWLGELGDVVVENDGRMYALGEWRYGAGRGAEDMVCLTLGTGVGCGVVLGGKLLRGARGVLGILGGHLTIDAAGERDTCGNLGCLEVYAGSPGLERAASHLLAGRGSLLHQDLQPATIFEAERAGDRVAGEVVAGFARTLAAGIVNLIHAYDPEVVVLGGGISTSADRFLPLVRELVAERAWTVPRGRVRIVPAERSEVAALLGVAALARGEVELL